jgi:acetyl-CoA synthetase
MRWLGKDDTVRDFTYWDLKALSNRFANVLRTLGIGKGERVFVLTGRLPELYIAALPRWAPSRTQVSFARCSPPLAPSRSTSV